MYVPRMRDVSLRTTVAAALAERVRNAARKTGKSQSELLRQIIDEGLRLYETGQTPNPPTAPAPAKRAAFDGIVA